MAPKGQNVVLKAAAKRTGKGLTGKGLAHGGTAPATGPGEHGAHGGTAPVTGPGEGTGPFPERIVLPRVMPEGQHFTRRGRSP